MTRRLYRSRTDSILGGVAAGLATYLNADPALVRIAWAILVPLTGGVALIAYIVAAFVVPEEPARVRADATASTSPAATAADEPAPAQSDGRAGMVVGIGLVLIGLWFLVRPTLPDIDWNLVWPLVIVAIGGLILFRSLGRSDR